MNLKLVFLFFLLTFTVGKIKKLSNTEINNVISFLEGVMSEAFPDIKLNEYKNEIYILLHSNKCKVDTIYSFFGKKKDKENEIINHLRNIIEHKTLPSSSLDKCLTKKENKELKEIRSGIILTKKKIDENKKEFEKESLEKKENFDTIKQSYQDLENTIVDEKTVKAKHFFQLQKKELDKNIASQVGTYMSKLDRIKELQSTINILSESLNDL